MWKWGRKRKNVVIPEATPVQQQQGEKEEEEHVHTATFSTG
jgi:hypothetical protein